MASTVEVNIVMQKIELAGPLGGIACKVRGAQVYTMRGRLENYFFVNYFITVKLLTTRMYQMYDFPCFLDPLLPLVKPISDCYKGWQMCPVDFSVSTIYFETQICSGLCVCVLACSLRSIHPLTRASPPLTSASQEMTGECNPTQSPIYPCSDVTTTCLSAKDVFVSSEDCHNGAQVCRGQ